MELIVDKIGFDRLKIALSWLKAIDLLSSFLISPYGCIAKARSTVCKDFTWFNLHNVLLAVLLHGKGIDQTPLQSANTTHWNFKLWQQMVAMHRQEFVAGFLMILFRISRKIVG